MFFIGDEPDAGKDFDSFISERINQLRECLMDKINAYELRIQAFETEREILLKRLKEAEKYETLHNRLKNELNEYMRLAEIYGDDVEELKKEIDKSPLCKPVPKQYFNGGFKVPLLLNLVVKTDTEIIYGYFEDIATDEKVATILERLKIELRTGEEIRISFSDFLRNCKVNSPKGKVTI